VTEIVLVLLVVLVVLVLLVVLVVLEDRVVLLVVLLMLEFLGLKDIMAEVITLNWPFVVWTCITAILGLLSGKMAL
jgi:hypothetical protein